MNELPALMNMIATLQGQMFAHQAFMNALYEMLSPAQKMQFAEHFGRFEEVARNSLLPEQVPEGCIDGFESSIHALRTTL